MKQNSKIELFLDDINKMLKNENYKEQFVIEEQNFSGGTMTYARLYHLENKVKNIDFFIEGENGILCFFNTHLHIDYFGNWEDFVSVVFEEVEEVISDKKIAFSNGHFRQKGTIGGAFTLDTDKAFLNDDALTQETIFSVWSDKSSDKIMETLLQNDFKIMPK